MCLPAIDNVFKIPRYSVEFIAQEFITLTLFYFILPKIKVSIDRYDARAHVCQKLGDFAINMSFGF